MQVVSRGNAYPAIVRWAAAGALLLAGVFLTRPLLAEIYYPPPESKGGWRTLVAKNAAPTAEQKAAVLKAAGLDTDQLVDAWKYVESLGPRQVFQWDIIAWGQGGNRIVNNVFYGEGTRGGISLNSTSWAPRMPSHSTRARRATVY